MTLRLSFGRKPRFRTPGHLTTLPALSLPDRSDAIGADAIVDVEQISVSLTRFGSRSNSVDCIHLLYRFSLSDAIVDDRLNSKVLNFRSLLVNAGWRKTVSPLAKLP